MNIKNGITKIREALALVDDDYEDDTVDIPNFNIICFTFPFYIISILCIAYFFMFQTGSWNAVRIFFIMSMPFRKMLLPVGMILLVVSAGGFLLMHGFVKTARICGILQVSLACSMLAYILIYVSSISGYIQRGAGSILFLVSSIFFCVGTFMAKPIK